MRIRLAVPQGLNQDETKASLDAALESVTRTNEALLGQGAVPTFAQALKGGGVRWRPEPPGDEHFDLAPTVLRRGWGDCDDLAPWHAASLRITGQDPEATAVVRPSGPNRWHAVVRRHDGSISDPSKAAGMGVVGGDEYAGPFWDPMFGPRLALANYPMQGGGHAARVDVPSAGFPMAYSVLQGCHGRDARRRAVVGALLGATKVCCHDQEPEDYYRMAALHDLLNGVPIEVVGEALEQEGERVGFFGALAPAALSFAAPIANKILPGILPGGSPAPAPSSAPSGGGGGGGYSVHPGGGGTIIVRF